MKLEHIVIAVVAAVFLAFIVQVIRDMSYVILWIRCRKNQLNLSLWQITAMRITRTNPHNVVNAFLMAKEHGIVESDSTLTLANLAAHELAGGSAIRVVTEMQEARRVGRETQCFEQLAALDLAHEPPFDVPSHV